MERTCNSATERARVSSSESSSRIMNLQLEMRVGGALLRLAQTFAAARVDLRQHARRPAASPVSCPACQAGRTLGRKEKLCSQAFSKRKTPDLGMTVDIRTRSGVRLEVGRMSEVSAVSGNAVQCEVFVNTRSNRANLGLSRIFDQV